MLKRKPLAELIAEAEQKRAELEQKQAEKQK
jgi:hypothetical protein